MEDTRASPMRAESLAGLPPAYVITAKYDPLCDEGEAYAERLSKSGVKTVHRRYDDAIHGFFTMTVTERTKEAIRDAALAVRSAFAE